MTLSGGHELLTSAVCAQVAQIVVLVFTDIVDSTALNEALGDTAMALLWQQHDRLGRELAGQWQGLEVGRSDGFLMLFSRPEHAIGFARAYQAMTRKLPRPLKARVGCHIGPILLRENSVEDRARGATPFELDGAALPVAARIMSTALGSQTLISSALAKSLDAPSACIRSHGHWVLKGLADPLELFEAGEADAPFSPPPDSEKAYRVVRSGGLWLPRRGVPNSLPVDRDSFVGRLAPLRTISEVFERGSHLVSLLGIGGAGKTRLAVRYGWSRIGEYPGGVWFCDVSSARGVEDIVRAVADGLGVPLGSEDPIAQLSRILAGRERSLLILDNFEQVSRLAETTLGRWLGGAPNVRMLVTTREVLGITGESTIAVAPLSIEEGVELFAQRAAAVNADRPATDSDTANVVRLVELLDGLPLAIELAAARTVMMSTRSLLSGMRERFKVLTARGGRSARQSTLRRAFDWSWDLLNDVEKSVLAQLAVFEGGISAQAAAGVLSLPEVGKSLWVPDVLQSLVHKSLLRVCGDMRFDLLSTVQEYVGEHLCTPGRFPGSGTDFAADTRARHYGYFAQLDESAAVGNRCEDIGNLLTACRRATQAEDTPPAVRALVNAWAALKLRGPFQQGLELADALCAHCALDLTERASVEWVAGSAHLSLGNTDAAKERLDRGLEAARQAHSLRHEGRLLCTLGAWFALAADEKPAADSLRAAIRIAERVSEPLLQMKALNELGALAQDRARISDARAHYESALRLAEQWGDLRWQGAIVGNLGGLLHAQEQHAEAQALYLRAIDCSQHCGDRRMEANNRCNLGLLLHDRGAHSDACVQFEQVLATARDLGNPRLESLALCNMGLAAEAQGRLGDAIGLQRRAAEVATLLKDRRTEGEIRMYLGRLLKNSGRYGEARTCFSAGEAALVESGDHYHLALLLCLQTESELAEGHRMEAVAAFARAEDLVRAAAAEVSALLKSALGRCRCLFVESSR